MKTIYFPAGTEHVQFGGLAQLMAGASNPLSDDATDVELIAHGGARLNWEEELLGAAKSGALPIKDSYTLGPCSYAVGFALQWSLVSIEDLRVFLAGRPFAIEVAPSQRPLNYVPSIEAGPDMPLPEQYELNARLKIAAGRCTLHEAAKILNIDTENRHTSILETMKAAAKSGLLPVYARGQQNRYVYEEYARVSVFDTEVFCDELDKWLEVNEPKVKYRFLVPLTEAPEPVGASNKKWTVEKLAELNAYRTGHTMAETVAKFGISEQRIRQLSPSKKPKAKPFASLVHRMK